MSTSFEERDMLERLAIEHIADLLKVAFGTFAGRHPEWMLEDVPQQELMRQAGELFDKRVGKVDLGEPTDQELEKWIEEHCANSKKVKAPK